MKTNFESEEEKLFLYFLLNLGIQSTDHLIFNHQEVEIKEYHKRIIYFRKRCFECLGEKDPNETIVDSILDNINLASIGCSY